MMIILRRRNIIPTINLSISKKDKDYMDMQKYSMKEIFNRHGIPIAKIENKNGCQYTTYY